MHTEIKHRSKDKELCDNKTVHETPTPNIPLSQQESKGGCIRMNASDIEEFSANVQYLDKIYSISNQSTITY